MSFSKILVIFSISSDIGYELAKSRLESGWQVFGTYRKYTAQVADLISLGGVLVLADFESRGNLKIACDEIISQCVKWDELIIAPGTLEPIGPFESCDFESWAASININFTNQLYVVYEMLAARNRNSLIVFFAGGGANGTADRFSAYTVSKIALTKMTELLDSEIPDIRCSIIGPGWIDTKIHNETLKAKELAGDSFDETVQRRTNNSFGSIKDVVQCINWLSDINKNYIGGRNICVQHDAWGTAGFQNVLKNNCNAGKLRRFANDELNSPQKLV